MEISEWLPLLHQEYRRWIESHPHAILAEPVLEAIEAVGGPSRDDPFWSRESPWGHADHADPRFLPRDAIAWVYGLPDRHLDPDAGRPHPSAAYFRNRGRWNR